MVDEERVVRLLDRIRADVERLRGHAAALGAEDDDLVLAAVKYRLITAIEGCGRVAHHIAAAEGWSAPDSSAGAIGSLRDHEVIDGDVAERLGRATGLRNLLVHQYGDIDDGRVVAHLDDLGDLDDFSRQVATWLSGLHG